MSVLSDSPVGAVVAVADMDRARGFYEDKLGLADGRETGDGGVSYSCGSDTELHIFPGTGAGKSESTVAGWTVENLEAAVDELSGRGVTFEQYDEPTKTDERGIFEAGEVKGAWIKDPDGNVLALIGS
jgi:catechol 2,3-dioxygenase-like lactoylglutathione lyase family enzyme